MSLFICQNPTCGCVENTNLVNRNILSNDGYPNMHLMDMQGHGDEVVYNGSEFLKHPQDILMLCSECNTGIWHGEFPKEKPDEEIQCKYSILDGVPTIMFKDDVYEIEHTVNGLDPKGDIIVIKYDFDKHILLGNHSPSNGEYTEVKILGPVSKMSDIVKEAMFSDNVVINLASNGSLATVNYMDDMVAMLPVNVDNYTVLTQDRIMTAKDSCIFRKTLNIAKLIIINQ